MRLRTIYVAFMPDLSLISLRLRQIVDVVFAGSSHAAAIAADVQPSTLHRLLDGSVSDPRMGTLRSLAESFGVPLGWLVGDMSTEAAQGTESNLPEGYWLLRSYHGRRQRAARAAITDQERPHQNHVAENSQEFDYFRNSALSPEQSVAALIRAIPEQEPDRLDYERRLAQLETDLLERAANIKPRTAVHTTSQKARRAKRD